jgi:hypothetical protein
LKSKPSKLTLLPASADVLLGSLFDPEDGGNTFAEMWNYLQTRWCYNPEEHACQ